MAAKRITQSAVDWVAFAERVPPNQKDIFRAFQGKSQQFLARVHKNPENMPAIDWAYFQKTITTPGLVGEFQKKFDALNVPYPKDKDNLLGKVDQEAKDMQTQLAALKKEVDQISTNANVGLSKLNLVPPVEEMSLEVAQYFFPRQSLHNLHREPKLWPYVDFLQPDHPTQRYRVPK